MGWVTAKKPSLPTHCNGNGEMGTKEVYSFFPQWAKQLKKCLVMVATWASTQLCNQVARKRNTTGDNSDQSGHTTDKSLPSVRSTRCNKETAEFCDMRKLSQNMKKLPCENIKPIIQRWETSTSIHFKKVGESGWKWMEVDEKSDTSIRPRCYFHLRWFIFSAMTKSFPPDQEMPIPLVPNPFNWSPNALWKQSK